MFMKIMKRMEASTAEEGLRWARANSSDLNSFCKKLNESLWEESISEFQKTSKRALKEIRSTNQELGGGGSFPLIYFLCRLNKPKIIIETGVAAGWSSCAALKAIKKMAMVNYIRVTFPIFVSKTPKNTSV